MNDLSTEFWNIVGEPADPTELEVGDALNLEWGQLRQVKIIAEKWVDGHGQTQIRIRDPRPGETFNPPQVTVIATGEVK